MKLKIALLLIVSVLCIQDILAMMKPQYAEAAKEYFKETMDKASPGKNWNFEIQNKFPGTVQVYVIDRSGTLRADKRLSQGQDQRKFRIANINAKDGFNIILEEGRIGGRTLRKVIQPNPQRETIYLTIGSDFSIYPQTGAFLGLAGRTDSGLSLSKNKNVQITDILTAVLKPQVK